MWFEYLIMQTLLKFDCACNNKRFLFSVPSAFQDSNLSPALPLLTVNTEAENMFTEYSLFQHSDNEFSPLR